MTNQEQHDATIRPPQPDATARDPRPAATQDQMRTAGDANRQEIARTRVPTPAEVSQETVAEIAAEAEARARP
jgi:hypothetical protein